MTMEEKRNPESSLVGPVLRRIAFLLLVLILFVLVDNAVNRRTSAVVLRRSDCLEHLSGLSRDLWGYCLAHPDCITPDTTVPDVIRAAMRDREIDEKHLVCARDGRSYLVFPAPASVFRLEREMEHVPIVMDRPDAHEEGAFVTAAFRLIRKEDPVTVRVLYADGVLEVVSREDAERLVAAHSPRPIELDPEAPNEVKP